MNTFTDLVIKQIGEDLSDETGFISNIAASGEHSARRTYERLVSQVVTASVERLGHYVKAYQHAGNDVEATYFYEKIKELEI